MSTSTHGLRVRSGSHAWRAVVELLSSMRFAIALLTTVCIASVIGTVVKQHEPSANYVNQFGPFWALLFEKFGLNAVYSAWWFLLILGFLVVSTTLCIVRSTPKILADLKAYKQDIRAQSLNAFHHRAHGQVAGSPAAAAARIGKALAGAGWKVKLQRRDTPAGEGWMVAAKAGAANKLGYLAAHSAIVLICIGGLFDGDLVVRAQTWFNGKSVYRGGGMIADVAPEHRLSMRNPTFRGNLMVAEGTQSSTAILSQSDGVLLQELPFAVELKKFIVEYYSTGMPKLFASDIVIHDRETGAQTPARVEVNHPVRYKGVEIYQSSFDDGGSTVKLRAVPLVPGGQPFEVEGQIGASTELVRGGDTMTLEYTALRVINVENLGGAPADGAVDVRKVDLGAAIDARLGAGNKTATQRELRNVGPSITYRLRDAAGQAREFHNYMLPVDTGDGALAFLLGVRATPAEPFRYLRIPADADDSMDTFVRLYAALRDPALREQAVQRYAQRAVDPQRPELAAQLAASGSKALALFAGGGRAEGQAVPRGGLQAIADFIEANVPEAERARAGEVLVRILNGTLFELVQLAQERAGAKPLDPDAPRTQGFMTQAVLSLSDALLYPAPMAFMLADFRQVQASVFQVARAPGRNIVYLGCLLLIVGVFAMLYVRERRLWVWLTPQGLGAGSEATMALSSNRRTLDVDREFERLGRQLIGAQQEAKQ
ncbi:cytochrome c biogenesis protein ResB [Pseudorhodoferax sp.]|uniref:cytochrome c biogenesis protein ResB n=1 Tax=Pseudorhodoferax sp. TaxID=1993553 RepID=UPI0039E58041